MFIAAFVSSLLVIMLQGVHLTEHVSHQKRTFTHTGCKSHFTKVILAHHSSTVYFAFIKRHAILISLKVLWKVDLQCSPDHGPSFSSV